MGITIISRNVGGKIIVTKEGAELRAKALARTAQVTTGSGTHGLSQDEINRRRIYEEASKPVAIGRNRFGVITSVSKGLEPLLGTKMNPKTIMKITTGRISKMEVRRAGSLSELEQRKRYGDVIRPHGGLVTGVDSRGRQVTFRADAELLKKLTNEKQFALERPSYREAERRRRMQEREEITTTKTERSEERR